MSQVPYEFSKEQFVLDKWDRTLNFELVETVFKVSNDPPTCTILEEIQLNGRYGDRDIEGSGRREIPVFLVYLKDKADCRPVS